MFESEQQHIEAQIRQFLALQNLPQPEQINWTPIPFSGEWGISMPVFPIAAQEARQSGAKINVQARAQEIGEQIARYLGLPPGFAHIDAVRGYLNLYFSTTEFSQRVVDTVLDMGAHFGWGERLSKLVMVEFSQPNTHKAFHVGHLRSAILGDTLCRIDSRSIQTGILAPGCQDGPGSIIERS